MCSGVFRVRLDVLGAIIPTRWDYIPAHDTKRNTEFGVRKAGAGRPQALIGVVQHGGGGDARVRGG
jgi:hypothetical protein